MSCVKTSCIIAVALALTVPLSNASEAQVTAQLSPPLEPIVHYGCLGDCNLDGAVGINELVTGVNVALGIETIDRCRQLNPTGSTKVTVTELVAAVNEALHGCPRNGLSVLLTPPGNDAKRAIRTVYEYNRVGPTQSADTEVALGLLLTAQQYIRDHPSEATEVVIQIFAQTADNDADRYIDLGGIFDLLPPTTEILAHFHRLLMLPPPSLDPTHDATRNPAATVRAIALQWIGMSARRGSDAAQHVLLEVMAGSDIRLQKPAVAHYYGGVRNRLAAQREMARRLPVDRRYLIYGD